MHDVISERIWFSTNFVVLVSSAISLIGKSHNRQNRLNLAHSLHTITNVFVFVFYFTFLSACPVFRVLSLTLSRTCCRPGVCRYSAWSAGPPSSTWRRIPRACTASLPSDRFQHCQPCWEQQLLSRGRERNDTSQTRHSRCSTYKRPCSSVDGCSWATEFSQRSTPASHLRIPARPRATAPQSERRPGQRNQRGTESPCRHIAPSHWPHGICRSLHRESPFLSLLPLATARDFSLSLTRLSLLVRFSSRITLSCLSSSACSTSPSSSWLYPEVARLAPTWFSPCFLSHRHVALLRPFRTYAPVSSSFFRAPVVYHGLCGLLRACCTNLTLAYRVFPFIPLVPSSAPSCIVAPFPFFFFLFRLFPLSSVVTKQTTRVDLRSDFDKTSQVHRANASSMRKCIVLVNQIME